jgi:hypothetical protein
MTLIPIPNKIPIQTCTVRIFNFIVHLGFLGLLDAFDRPKELGNEPQLQCNNLLIALHNVISMNDRNLFD